MTKEERCLFYHSANPYVGGWVDVGKNSDSDGYVLMTFDRPVGFSYNKGGGLRRRWWVNYKLLFKTSKEAVIAAVKYRMGLKGVQKYI